MLKDDKKLVRDEAAIALGNLRDKRATPHLIANLKDEDENVRREVVYVLSSMGDKRAVLPLIEALNDKKNEHIIDEIVRGLCFLHDKKAVEPLLALLNKYSQCNYSYSVYTGIMEALSWIGDNRAVGPLVEIILDDDPVSDIDEDMQMEAIDALGCIGGKKAVECLVKVLERGGTLGVSAVFALGRIGDNRAVEPLIRALDSRNEYQRQCAAEALGSIGDNRSVVPLIRVLRDDYATVRIKATWALGRIEDNRAVKPLGKLFKLDKGEMVRVRAACALFRITGKMEFFDYIAVAATKEQRRWVRIAAAKFLGRSGRKEALEPLIACLEDKDKEVRGHAAQALGRLGDRKAMEPLKRVLKDDNEEVRTYAVKALGKIGGEDAVKTLIEVLSNETRLVRRPAVKFLRKLTKQDIGDDYRKWKEWYKTQQPLRFPERTPHYTPGGHKKCGAWENNMITPSPALSPARGCMRSGCRGGLLCLSAFSGPRARPPAAPARRGAPACAWPRSCCRSCARAVRPSRPVRRQQAGRPRPPRR
jgi:HEAT repeat protein